jgi:GT2 family glycosyltransferase
MFSISSALNGMNKPEITVVIPAFNNVATIREVLTRLARQRGALPHRVIVVDDGSSDATADAVRASSRRDNGVTLISGPHRGAGAARNAGAGAADTELLLFLGADILPGPSLLRRHLSIHRQEPGESTGCLGFVTWDPRLPPTPFMVFLEHGGPQNAYGDIAGQTWVDPRRFFYGSNISLKRRAFLDAGGFDAEHFPGYGWEDLELGMRLAARGFRLRYEPAARGVHHHAVHLRDALNRMRAVGRGARVLAALHPEAEAVDLHRERRVGAARRAVFSPPVRRIVLRAARASEKRLLLHRLYRRNLSLAFYDGVHDADEF